VRNDKPFGETFAGFVVSDSTWAKIVNGIITEIENSIAVRNLRLKHLKLAHVGRGSRDYIPARQSAGNLS